MDNISSDFDASASEFTREELIEQQKNPDTGFGTANEVAGSVEPEGWEFVGGVVGGVFEFVGGIFSGV